MGGTRVCRVERLLLWGLTAFAVVAACGGDAEPVASQPEGTEQVLVDPTVEPSTTSTTTVTSEVLRWSEEEVWFRFDGEELFGVLTAPTDRDGLAAVVLVSGSGDEEGIRANSSTRIFIDHARRLAEEGYAVLRYDPPGVGRSSGSRGLPSLERRAEETMAALRFVAARPETDPGAVGLQGWSQGPWVMAMAAARYPDEVAFLVSVVGSGQTVAEQQVYGIEAQSRTAGLDEDDVAKAVVIGRLLVDWQLIEPMYRDVNEAAIAVLGDGPWTAFAEVVYDPGDVDPVAGVARVTGILDEVADEPWAVALHLRELYLPRFESIPADIPVEDLAAIQVAMDTNLRTDPADFLTEVRAPVLAVFGEDDDVVDSDRSARLYEQYLAEAGNEDVTIVVLPEVGHDIGVPTPGYWELVTTWLGQREVAAHHDSP